jgi:hypothetical protein
VAKKLTKSKRIEAIFRDKGIDTPTRDVLNHLKKQHITASPSLVSYVRGRIRDAQWDYLTRLRA